MHSSIDARRYDAWVTRGPDWDDREPWQELLHCKFCGAWVSTKLENKIIHIEHTKPDLCRGWPDPDGYDLHPECPLGEWVDKTPEEIAALPKWMSYVNKKYVIPDHVSHIISCYNGQSTYFRCNRCGGEAELAEF
jgi:hypothetical protein